MVTSTKKSHILLAVVIAGIFAAASACLATLGVCIYRTAACDHSQQNLSSASEYLQEQVRACSDPADLRISTLSGQIQALVLPADNDGEELEVWIFAEDGYLQSTSVKPGEDVSAKNASKITPLRSMAVRISENNLLEISLRSDSASSVSRVWVPGIGGSNE